MMKTLSCEEVLANLSDYVDEQNSAEVRKALEEHIGWCRRCRVVFDTTKQALKIVVDSDPFEVPLSVSARLYARLEKILAEA